MKEKTDEERQRIVEKWRPILEGPNTPLSACKCILIESQERWMTSEELESEEWYQGYMCKFVDDSSQ
jgi:hypothetical protein